MLGTFSLTSIFYSIDTDIIAYLLLFLSFFALIHFLLNRTMLKDSKGVLNVISISSALLIIYGLIKVNFSIAELMFRMNLPPMLQYNLVWIIFLLIFIIFWVKLGLGICLMIIGLGLIIIGALKLVYADTELIITGIIMFLIGLWLYLRRKKKKIPTIKIKPWLPRPRPPRPRPGPRPGPKPPKPGPIPKPGPTPKPEPKPRKEMGEASLDVIIGGRSVRGGRATLDLTSSDSTIIYVKNGGTGGTLGWRASCNNELSLSKTHGKLALGKYHEIKVRVRKRDGREYASVIISGGGGGHLGGRKFRNARRGRIMVTFKIKNKKSSNLVDRFGNPL